MEQVLTEKCEGNHPRSTARAIWCLIHKHSSEAHHHLCTMHSKGFSGHNFQVRTVGNCPRKGGGA